MKVNIPRKLVIRLGSAGVAILLVTALLLSVFIPARVDVTGGGRLSITFEYKVYASPDTQARVPSTVTTDGTEDPWLQENWINPGAVCGDNATYAYIIEKTFDTPDFSYQLKATGFGFDIPPGTTIDGIAVEMDRHTEAIGGVGDALIQLIKDGTRQGDNMSAAGLWLTSDNIATFGSSTDKWSLGWTSDNINASNFGVTVACQAVENNVEAYIDFLRITVYYSYPDISVDPTSRAFGPVAASTSYWSLGANTTAPSWPLIDGECYFTVSNNSTAAVDIGIKAIDFIGGVGWVLADTPATDNVTLKVWQSGDAEVDAVTLTTNDKGFITGLGAPASMKWELKMETPTSFGDYVLKTGTITLTATFSP